MPIIYENDEDKYYDQEELKILRKGSQSGVESRSGNGLFLPGTKYGNGLYLPSRKAGLEIYGEGNEVIGEGIIDSIINAGKTVIEGISSNASTISQASNAIGSIANAASSTADAIKNIRKSVIPVENISIKERLALAKERGRKMIGNNDRVEEGSGFRITP